MVMLTNWLRQRVRRPGVQPVGLEPGRIYLFAYEPTRGEQEKTDLDRLPVFIPLLMRSGGMRGVNILALYDPILRRRFLETYRRAIAAGDKELVARRLYDLYRIVTSDNRNKDANRYYGWRQIRGRVVELTLADLEELIARIL